MEETKFEMSKEGITFPYRRYLSDSASGFVLILLFSILLKDSPGIQNFLSDKFASEARVFILVLLFLLSTPIGVMVNVISWMCFESLQKFIERAFLSIGFSQFKKEYKFEEIFDGMGITKENWFQTLRVTESKLVNKKSIYIDRLESLRGIAILVRNLSLISLVIAGYLAVKGYDVQSYLSIFALSVFLLYLSAVVSFYLHIQTMFWGTEPAEYQKQRHYIFGYGSLISKESRAETGKTGATIPATIRGFKRAWNVTSPMKISGVGIVPDDNGKCNGLLIEIEESELPVFDKRELEGTNNSYERLEIRPNSLITGKVPVGSKIWVYAVKQPVRPAKDYPIAQSYLDVILVGCLEHGKKFAQEFIELTFGWEIPWINDRDCPRYIRAVNNAPAREIDSLLRKHVKSFNKRKDSPS